MKTLRSGLCLLLALVMLLLTATSCKKDKPDDNTAKYDSENDVVRFAIEGQDGVFNPFFSTTAYDSEIAGMTQIGMLTTSGKGAKISYAENEACVTLRMTETKLDAAGNVIPADDTTTTVARTRYSFVIKNGIKIVRPVIIIVLILLFIKIISGI